GPISASLNRARATARQASTLPNIGCRNDNLGGSGIAWAAHSPYAPIMFGVIVYIFAEFPGVCNQRSPVVLPLTSVVVRFPLQHHSPDGVAGLPELNWSVPRS